MPTAPTQAERSAALARLRAHLADPDSPPPSHADLQVLLNPNAQAVAMAAENEALRGRVADLEGKIKAGRPEPGLAEVRFLPTPADLAADLDDADWGWLWITRVDAMRLFRALTKVRGGKIDKTPTITSATVHCAAIRLAALVEMAEEKDRRIAELEEQLRTINAALDRYHANVGIEPGTMQIGQVLDYAATHYLEREHLTSEVRVLEEDPASAPTSEHLPCPFCGGKGFVNSKVAPYSPTTGSVRCRAAVACGQCSMIGPGAVGDNHTESIANAWAAWDRRGGAR